MRMINADDLIQRIRDLKMACDPMNAKSFWKRDLLAQKYEGLALAEFEVLKMAIASEDSKEEKRGGNEHGERKEWRF